MEREFCKKCSKCGERAVVIATIPYELRMDHDGRKYQVGIDDLSVPRCGKCGNFSFDYEADMQITRAFCKQAGLLNGNEIRLRREKLGLSLEALAELLGVEVRDLAWWENGERIQPRHLDRFLRAVFTLPELRKTLADSQALALSAVN